MDRFYKELWSTKGVEVKDRNTLNVKVWGDQLTISFNGVY